VDDLADDAPGAGDADAPDAESAPDVALTVRPLRRRRRWWILGIALAVLVVFSMLTARLFFRPSIDAPAAVDAIVVLGGEGKRIERGIELARAGFTDQLVVSEAGGRQFHYRDVCTLPPSGLTTYCFDPDPRSTRGEARAIAKLAADYGWTRIIVVASTDQITRARMIIGRCFGGEIHVVDVASTDSAFYRGAYEWGALLKAVVVNRDC
jgi:uncharacterized SAM-binding protein YcdF (DUF218 family)